MAALSQNVQLDHSLANELPAALAENSDLGVAAAAVRAVAVNRFPELQLRDGKRLPEGLEVLVVGCLDNGEVSKYREKLSPLEELALIGERVAREGTITKDELDILRTIARNAPANSTVLSTLNTLCENISQLTFVNLTDEELKFIGDNCSNLQQLILRNWPELPNPDCITSLQPLASLKQLQTLYVSRYGHITNLQPLARLSTLQTLDLSYCSGITDLEPLVGLDNLQILKLTDCSSITDITPLASLRNLKDLDLKYCARITNLAPIQHLSRLRILDLSYTRIGTAQDPAIMLTPLSQLTQLLVLRFVACQNVTEEDLLQLTKCRSLDDLITFDLSRNQQLTDEGIRELRSHLPTLRNFSF